MIQGIYFCHPAACPRDPGAYIMYLSYILIVIIDRTVLDPADKPRDDGRENHGITV